MGGRVPTKKIGHRGQLEIGYVVFKHPALLVAVCACTHGGLSRRQDALDRGS
jgi:hypothetical protein